jgi:rubrerythrin
MKFGIIKSKIEKVLLESYANNTFKDVVKTFNYIVLDNKNLSKMYYLYEELNSNKGLNETVAKDYINESIKIYENTLNKITESDLRKLNIWLSDVKCNNIYEHIDNVFNLDVLNIESNINAKKVVVESLKKTPVKKQEPVNIPISTMVKVANKTITNYVENLNESEKQELTKLLKEDDKELKQKFQFLKESLLTKLENMKSSESDVTIQSRINETLTKVSSEKYDKLTYFKLKNLNENL